MFVSQDLRAPTGADVTKEVVVLDFSGKLDGSSIDALISSAQENVEKGVRHLILNLSDVESISDIGVVGLYMVAELLEGRSLDHLSGWSIINEMSRALKHGSQFRNLSLVAPSQRVARTLSEHGFDRAVRMQPSLGDAVLALAA